ncbi:MAG: hypothetical protein ACK4GJ_06835, partial [bacterium]
MNLIFITGGVISSLGKGVITASIISILEEIGFKVKKSYCFKKCAQSPVVKINEKFLLKADSVEKCKKFIEFYNNKSEKTSKDNFVLKNLGKNGNSKKIKIKRCIAGNCLHHNIFINPDYFEVENCGCLGYCGKGPAGIIDNRVYSLSEDLLEAIKDDISKLESFESYTFERDQKIITKFNDQIDPLNIDSYIKVGGFKGLEKALKMKKEEIIEIAYKAGIRGRGGAAFPLHIKLKGVCDQQEHPKYVVANLEEGEVASFCNTILAESNPFVIIEGMAIAAYVVGASKGFIFVNYKAKEAIDRLKKAVQSAREKGFLKNEDFEFDIEIRRSPSAYIAGEETAMLEVIEGKKAMPRNRPPFPFQSGLFGKPTLINNVETLAALAYAVNYGPEEFQKFGTDQSKGTKIISLTGNVNNPCTVEVPFGIKISEIIEKYGGGFREENKGFLIGG